METSKDMASVQSKAGKEFPSQEEVIPELSRAENTQLTLSQHDFTNIEKLHPGAKTQTIISLSESIRVSIDKFMVSAPTQLSRGEFRSFLEGIRVSTANIHLLSEALILSDAVGDFIMFPKLPTELRLKIWKLCLPARRAVEFYAKVIDFEGKMERNIGIRQVPHALFRICAESRQIALERYSLQLSKSKYQLANTRIDPNTDVLILDAKNATSGSVDLSILKEIWSQEAKQMKTIGTTLLKWNATFLGHLLKTFKEADELTLLLPFLDYTSGHYISRPIDLGEGEIVITKMENRWDCKVAVDKLWVSRGGKPYAGRKKPALFYCQRV